MITEPARAVDKVAKNDFDNGRQVVFHAPDGMKTAINKMQKPICVGGYTSQRARHSLWFGIAGLSS